ncbi:MAG: Calx-beta domain-containing protein [Actinomycetota bacterium]
MSRGQIIGIGVALVVAVVAGVLVWQVVDDGDDGGGSADDGPTFVIAPVERRDLSDEITVRGEIRRDELQRLTSGIDGRVSSVLVDDGDTINAGDVIFALDGRAAVAVEGDFSFFRELDVGSDGPDVLQLERILADQGHQVGIVDQLYTEETRAGLREWQIANGYGGATPEPDENIVISIQNNQAGYRIGPQNTISIQLGPSVPGQTVPVETSGLEPDTDADDGDGDDEESLGLWPSEDDGPRFFAAFQPAVPLIDVTVSPTTVEEGGTATFTFTSDIPMPAATVIDYQLGGAATGADNADDGDYDNTGLDGTFVFPAGATSFDLVVTTFEDDVIEGNEALTVTVGTALVQNDTENYRPGPLKEATLVITSPDDEVPGISVSADQPSVDEGGTLGFTFETDTISNDPVTIFFRLGGSARNGSDYTEIDELEIELPAGADSVTLNVATIDDDIVENDETVVVELNTTRRRARYEGVGQQSASAVIEADDNDLPELRIEGGGLIGEGEVAAFTIYADQAVVKDTSINYNVSGSATPGRDYQELSGTALMKAGQNHVHIGIRTIDDDVIFRPGDMIVADWPARIGTVSVDDGEFILQGQEVLTLTEPDFTITLLLSPTDRGNLDPGMAVRVELQASDQEAVPGFIVELDDNATIDASGGETYEGVVETQEPLGAVDGAGVNVDVIREERLDVITVPVAAVLQDGEGDDVVRVVLTDGTTRQVKVEVGLSEGAFVEITEGLTGDEIVLVET